MTLRGTEDWNCPSALTASNAHKERAAERERIARELHDTFLQGFQGLLLQLQSIANRVPPGDGLRNEIVDALDRVDIVLADGRARLRELRCCAATADFAQSLTDAASKIAGSNVSRFRLTVEGKQRTLHVLVGEEVLRIFEEAVRNVVQHANANTIDALLSYGDRAFRLTVRDDGVGIAKSQLTARCVAAHFGLLGMNERAARIGGRLRITSREGVGTEVIVSTPARAAYGKYRVGPRDHLSPGPVGKMI